MRSAVTLLAVLWTFTPAPAGEEKPAAKEAGPVEVKVQGKLFREGGRLCVRAKSADTGAAFLMELIRTEDKNRDLDEHLRGLEGKAVTVTGKLRFIPGRADGGPALGVPIRDEAQVRAAAAR